MPKFIFTSLIVFYFTPCFSQIPDNAFAADFEVAYEAYPEIPRGILESISFEQSRFNNLQPAYQSSCIGMPIHYGPMGLVADGKSYFRNTLDMIAELSSTDKSVLLSNPSVQIIAFAKSYACLMKQYGIKTTSPWKEHKRILRQLSELPDGKAGLNYACDQQLYGIFSVMSLPAFSAKYMQPGTAPDMNKIFGRKKAELLSSAKVSLSHPAIQKIFGSANTPPHSIACLDYPLAIWAAADASNFSSRNGTPVSAVTIHDIEGSYAGAISWFQNPSANVSAHYVLRALDGQITQMVCESDKAWHVGSENPYTIGFEHEGYANYPGWFTANMYQASADLVKDICADYGINPLRTHYGPACTGSSSNCQLGGCIKIKGHQMYPNQTHTDPGPYWDWLYYYRLINDTMTVQVLNQSAGIFYDSGGNTGNYSDDERLFWKIAPPGAGSATLTFSSFDIEANWDYLYIYDGDNVYAPLIGIYTGTVSPGTITANSGRFFITFRSDCATTATGWAATWSGGAPASCSVPTGLNAIVDAFSASLNWAPVTGAIDYEIRWKQDIESTWHTDTANTTTFIATGLAANAVYTWQVRALCGADSSIYAGDMFTTTDPANENLTECAGYFYDSGGPVSTYHNDENYTVTIAPTGATSITVAFSSFDIENGWDYLYIYDGPSAASPQIPGSPFTGTTSPGSFTTSGGSVTFSFTSDVSTVNPGWAATWQCQGMPVALFNIPQSTICEGDSMMIQNLSSNALSYLWVVPGAHPDSSTLPEPFISFDTSGTYALTLIAYGSSANDTLQQSFSIQVDPLPVAGFTTQDTILMPPAIALFSNNSVNSSTYQWDFGDSSTSNDISPWHIYDSTGQYVIALVANNSCGNDTTWDTLTVITAAGLDGSLQQDRISVYPVPFSNELVLHGLNATAGTVYCELLDIRGQRVRPIFILNPLKDNQDMLMWNDLNDLSSGVYFIRIETGQSSRCYRLVKVR